jgi:outer membrane protein insertion porin family
MLLLLGAGPRPGSAQTIQNQGEITYEGQQVTSVEVAGRPGMDPSTVKPWIKQPVNAAYSQEKVDATVAALKKAGVSENVEVHITPEPNGLRLLFVLEPAYYFGVFRFPGISRFTYPRLLQAANYQTQEPYTAGKVGESQSGLLVFLHQAGFFEATVEPELQTDPELRVVNVVFHIDLKRRADFGEITIEGLSPAEAQRLEGGLRSFRSRLRGIYIKPGRGYSQRRVQAGIRYMQAELGKRHFLAARVRLVSTIYDPATNRASLNFQITKGPEVNIAIEGAHVRDRTKKKLIPVFQEYTVDPDLVREGEQNLISYFQSKGFFDVKVESAIQQNPGGATIVYQVGKGPRGKVKAVEFHGNEHFSDKELKQRVPVSKAKKYIPFFSHGRFSSRLLGESVDNLTALYQGAGYSQVRVTPRVNRQGGNLRVAFEVQEGLRDMVRSLRLEGNQSLDEEQLAPQGLNLEPGKPYSQLLLNKDRDQIVAVYLDRGFLSADFRAEVTHEKSHPHQVDVLYKIDEGPQVYTAMVGPIGAVDTKLGIVERAVNIKAGKPLSQRAMLKGESDLYGLGIFDWASVDTRRPIGLGHKQADVLVKLHESRRNSISYGLGFSAIRRGGSVPGGTVAVPGLPPVALPSNFETSEQTFVGPTGSIEYTRRNFRGHAETVSMGVYGAVLDQHAQASWLNPAFRNSSWSVTATIAAERNGENPLYTAQIETAGLQFQRFLDAQKAKSVFFRYNFSHTILSNLLIPELVLPQDQNVQLSTLSASFIRDTRDDVLDAHKGIYESFELDFNPSQLGSSANFARFLGQTAYYRPVFGGSSVWANSIRLGMEVSLTGEPIPISAAFFSGGGSTLRGFPLNGAGPQRPVPVCSNPADPSTCSNITVPVGGQQLLILNSELRFPLGILDKLTGAAFYDGGNVYGHLGNFWSDYTNSVGVGVRYSTPVGPIRLDVGHNLNPVPGLKSTQWFITLGQAF